MQKPGIAYEILDNMAPWPALPPDMSEATGTNNLQVTHPQVTQLGSHISEVIEDK